jgi:prolyl oligopeptidase
MRQMIPRSPRLCPAMMTVCAVALAQAVDRPHPPAPPVRLVTDNYFGHRVTDPYRWMEDMTNSELLNWMKEEDEYARALLGGLPLHDEFVKREREVRTQGVDIERVRQRSQRYVYVKESPASHSAKLYVRDGLRGQERLLVGAENPGNQDIEEFDLSPDGRYVAYVASSGGREAGDLYVVDVNTGTRLPDVIRGTHMIEPIAPGITCSSGTWWTPDSRSLAYRKPGSAGSLQGSSMMLHTLGTEQAQDLLLFGPGSTRIVEMGVRIPFVRFTKGGSYLVAQLGAGADPQKEFLAASTAHSRDRAIPWQRVNKIEDEVRDLSAYDGDIFLRSAKNTPRFEILRISAEDLGHAPGQTIFPAGEAVVETTLPTRDGLYVQVLEGGARKVYRLTYQSWKRELLPIPPNTSARIIANDPAEAGILLYLESWTKAPSIVDWDPATKQLTNTNWLPSGSLRMPALKVENFKVRSHDGVLVPLVVISPASRGPRKPLRTILFGYGASGIEWTAPYFAAGAIPWFEQGGIEAWVGARGGGEYGEEWQKAGTGANKPNTWKDFIACAEYLIRNGYTTPTQLGAIAVSAGGILAGNTLAERPDLFSAVAINAGLTNPLRLSFTDLGKGHQEFGQIGTETEF